MTSADETYVPIKALLIRVTRDAAMIAVGETRRVVSIPRSLIHGADERELDTKARALGHAHPAPEITLRIFLWKAREQHLLSHTVDGGAVGDLFKPKEDEP